MVWFIFASFAQNLCILARNDTLHNGGGGRRDGEGRVRRRGRGRFRVHVLGTKVMAWVAHNTAQDHHQTL